MTQVHSYYDKSTADLEYYSNVIQKKFSLFCNILVSACYLVTFILVTRILLHLLLITSLTQTVMERLHLKENEHHKKWLTNNFWEGNIPSVLKLKLMT